MLTKTTLGTNTNIAVAMLLLLASGLMLIALPGMSDATDIISSTTCGKIYRACSLARMKRLVNSARICNLFSSQCSNDNGFRPSLNNTYGYNHSISPSNYGYGYDNNRTDYGYGYAAPLSYPSWTGQNYGYGYNDPNSQTIKPIQNYGYGYNDPNSQTIKPIRTTRHLYIKRKRLFR